MDLSIAEWGFSLGKSKGEIDDLRQSIGNNEKLCDIREKRDLTQFCFHATHFYDDNLRNNEKVSPGKKGHDAIMESIIGSIYLDGGLDATKDWIHNNIIEQTNRESIHFYSKFFDELSTRELYEIARARTEIFLLEQGIVCRDLDGLDYDCLHCFLEEDGKLIAYLRAHKTEREGVVKIGRILTLTHGVGHGSLLMREAFEAIRERLGAKEITIHAQKHAEGFYKKHGFAVCSEDFWEEGVLHVGMRRSPI